jgi:PAS domain S-box-containing protein
MSELRVLCVDDDPMFRELLELKLGGREGVAVRAVTGGAAALDALDEGRFDCVVSAETLADTSGLALLQRVRERYTELPFVLFVADGSEQLAMEAIGAGVTDYVRKSGTNPFELLASRVHGHARSHRDRAALEHVRERHEIAGRVVSDVIWERDLREGSVHWGEGIAETLGYDRDGHYDREWWLDRVHPDDREAVRAAWAAAVEGGEDTFDCGYRFRRADGSYAHVADGGEVVRADGEPVRLVGALRDVTERHEQVARLEALLAVARDLQDADDRTAVCEQVAEAARDVLGLGTTGVWLLDDAGEALRPVAWTDDAGTVGEEAPVLRSGESLAWAPHEAGETRVFDRTGRATGVYDRGTDIRSELVVPIGREGVLLCGAATPDRFGELDEKLAELLAANAAAALARADREAELKRRERELARQNERLDGFASVVSHDLRNPLNVAQGRVELALENGDLDGLDRAAAALERMSALIDDLLALAREGDAVDATEPAGLATVARAAWATIPDRDDATLDCRVDDDLAVVADADRLRQLLENLFGNAVEHAAPDGGAITVTVGSLPDGFYVADDGVGIPPGARERVLELGYTTDDGGTGLGLSIVADIVTAHDWSLRVTASEDGGTRFEVTGVTFHDDAEGAGSGDDARDEHATRPADDADREAVEDD